MHYFLIYYVQEVILILLLWLFHLVMHFPLESLVCTLHKIYLTCQWLLVTNKLQTALSRLILKAVVIMNNQESLSWLSNDWNLVRFDVKTHVLKFRQYTLQLLGRRTIYFVLYHSIRQYRTKLLCFNLH